MLSLRQRLALLLLAASQIAAQDISQSSSASQSETASVTQTATRTPSATAVWSTLFDGTSQLAYTVLTDPASTTVVNSTVFAAVSFVVAETDSTCGPGSWSITQVVLPLSQVPGGSGAVTLTVQLFQANVRTRAHGACVSERVAHY